MNIAYINNHYQLGGAETVVRQLHEGALASGHDSRLHVTDGKSWPKAPGLRPLYPRALAYLNHTKIRSVINRIAPRRSWTNRAFLRLGRSDADIIHVHSFHGLYASLENFATVARAKPLVWTFHRFWGMTGGCDHPFGCTRYQTGCGVCPQVGRFAVGSVDQTAEEWSKKHTLLSPLPLHIIAPSQHLATKVRKSTLGQNWNVHVIPNGVDPSGFSGQRKPDQNFRRELGISPDRIIALFVCRDFKDPIKGFPIIKNALASRSWENLQIVFVGEHSSWARDQLSNELNIVDLGYLSDRGHLAEICEASDLFLYASDGENFPCVILEAMASECCVVTAPVDGVLEQVVDGVSGLIAVDNSPDALADALAKALAMPSQNRRALGLNARTRVKDKFSETGMINTHLALYSEIVQETGSI